jgi:MoxR-like ATPase
VAKLAGCSFRRVQCAVDTQPADIVGIRVWDPEQKEFILNRGPIFSNLILIDEINRLPPRSQSAFIEATGERQVTIDGITYLLDEPYISIATQNPFEREGTFPLIDAQKDRFMFSARTKYLERTDELEIIHRAHAGRLDWDSYIAGIDPLLTREDILSFTREVQSVHVEDHVLGYIRDLVVATREHGDVELGISTRGSIALVFGAKALAAINKRSFVLPDDVKHLVPAAFQHRLLLHQEAEISGITPRQIVGEVLNSVEVP